MIRRARSPDISSIVKLHMKNLKDGIFYNLGRAILKILYRELIADKDCFVFLHMQDNRILGVAASSINAPSFFSRFRNRTAFKIGLTMMFKSLTNPTLFLKALLLRYPSTYKAELVFLFVDTNARGKNIGTKLVNKTISEFRKHNVKKFKITILSQNLIGRRFYEKLGFKNTGTFDILNEKRNIYVYFLE